MQFNLPNLPKQLSVAIPYFVEHGLNNQSYLDRNQKCMAWGAACLLLNHYLAINHNSIYGVLIAAGVGGLVCGVMGSVEPRIYEEWNLSDLRVKLWQSASFIATLAGTAALYFGFYEIRWFQ